MKASRIESSSDCTVNGSVPYSAGVSNHLLNSCGIETAYAHGRNIGGNGIDDLGEAQNNLLD